MTRHREKRELLNGQAWRDLACVVCLKWYRHGERDRQTGRQADKGQRQRDRDRNRDRQTDRDTDRERMNESTLFYKGSGVDTGCFYINQPSLMRD